MKNQNAESLFLVEFKVVHPHALSWKAASKGNIETENAVIKTFTLQVRELHSGNFAQTNTTCHAKRRFS